MAAILHKQGSLDGMCGVYSVVNALTLMAGRRIDGKKAFAHIVSALEPRMSKVLVNGMHANLYHSVLDAGCDYARIRGLRIVWRPAFRGRCTSLAEFWTRIRLHQFEHGEGSVVLGISGARDHWTCVRRTTPRRLILADSDGMSVIQRARATIRHPTSSRIFSLPPRQTFFLKIVD